MIRTGHISLVLVTIFLAAYAGRQLARLVGQPSVVGEVAAGLVLGPAVVAIGGHGLLGRLLPADVFSPVRQLAHIGLVLFVVGVLRQMRSGGSWATRRAIGWVTFGALVPPLTAGFALAGWVLWRSGPGLRGDAPTPSLVLLLGVSMSVTAIPVLARILEDRGLTYTRAGRLSLAGAAVIDGVAWLLLTLAIGLAGGGSGDSVNRMAALAAGVTAAFVLARLLRAPVAGRLCGRLPWLSAVAVAALALTASWLMQRCGLSEVLGALLVGAALPAADEHGPWGRAVHRVSRTGALLIPLFFVVTGVSVFAGRLGSGSWQACVLATAAGLVAKIGGGYLGARLGGESHRVGLQVGVLLNTRGLTELVILQAGFSAGILTPRMYLALVVMALVTTAATGPLYTLVERQTSTAEELEASTVRA
ncbi:cation:proton antiporter [Streptomyces cyanogenus]|uniref:cation:proton antiporter n=1 Tax=Streptomyces cyanogenus TaxID=80860 RepID=UPI001FB78AB8|nr:cation:proton antiporter [Streptomyces cyanogenus]